MPGTAVDKRPPLPVPVPGMPVRKRESEALVPRAFRAARRNRHISAPLTLPPVLWTAGEILHAYSMGAEAGCATGAASIAVWAFAPHKWTGKNGEPCWREVWYARASAITLSGYLTGTAIAGALSPAAALSAIAAAAVWGIPWYIHKRPRGQKDRERLLAFWQAWWEGHCHTWGLAGSRVIETEEKGVTLRLRVQLMPGRHSAGTVRGVIDRIESALDGRSDIGMVRVAPVKGHPSQVDIFAKRENPLREVIEWDPALAPSSVHGEAVLGMSETGEWVTAPMRVNTFVNGKTRSGKGNHLLLRLAQLSGCPDDRQVVIDLKQRAARTLLRTGAVEHVITSREEARAYLAMLHAERAARARDADTGEEQLLATAMTPAIHTLIDEANPLTSVTAGDAECARLLALGASEGAGLEIYFEIATQYGALHESVRTEQTRSNLPLRVCYAVQDPDHGDFALGSAARYAGIDASKLEEKGEFLFKLGPKARPERLRAPHMPFSLFAEIAAENAARLRRPRLILYCGAEPSAVPGQTWQEWWDRRHLRIDPAFRKDSPQYAAAAAEFGEPEAQARESSASGAQVPASACARKYPEGGSTGAEIAAQIAADTSGPDFAPTAAAAAAASGARGGKAAQRDRFCDALAAATAGISPDALMKASGLARSTVMDYLKRLLGRGAVTRPEEGVYVPVPGRDIHAELRAVREGDAALGRQALQLVRSAS